MGQPQRGQGFRPDLFVESAEVHSARLCDGQRGFPRGSGPFDEGPAQLRVASLSVGERSQPVQGKEHVPLGGLLVRFRAQGFQQLLGERGEVPGLDKGIRGRLGEPFAHGPLQ
jgi:hypothetical protein